METLYLSRKNLLDLLAKLDTVKAGGNSQCAIIKRDNTHPIYPSSMDSCFVRAVEDEDYYTVREPGYVRRG